MVENQSQGPLDTQVPEVRNKAPKPPGVLPKNVQTWVLIGVAVVMVCVLALSGGRSPQPTAAESALKRDGVIDPNEARIQEYRNRLDAEARKLEAERERLKQAQAVLGMEPSADPDTASATPPFGSYRYSEPQERTAPQKTAIEQHKERRDYQSLFASNIALSYRGGASNEASGKSAPEPAHNDPFAAAGVSPQAVAPWWLPTTAPQSSAHSVGAAALLTPV